MLRRAINFPTGESKFGEGIVGHGGVQGVVPMAQPKKGGGSLLHVALAAVVVAAAFLQSFS